MSTHEQSETIQLLYKLNIRSLEDEDEDYVRKRRFFRISRKLQNL